MKKYITINTNKITELFTDERFPLQIQGVEKGKELEYIEELATSIKQPYRILSHRRARRRSGGLIKLENMKLFQDNTWTKLYKDAMLDIKNSAYMVDIIAKYECLCPCSDNTLARITFPLNKEELAEVVEKNYKLELLDDDDYQAFKDKQALYDDRNVIELEIPKEGN